THRWGRFGRMRREPWPLRLLKEPPSLPGMCLALEDCACDASCMAWNQVPGDLSPGIPRAGSSAQKLGCCDKQECDVFQGLHFSWAFRQALLDKGKGRRLQRRLLCHDSEQVEHGTNARPEAPPPIHEMSQHRGL